jgi:hypothetical protein
MSATVWSALAAHVSVQGMRRRVAKGQSLAVLVAGPWSWQVGREPALVARDGRTLGEVAASLLDAGHVAITGEMLALPIIAASGRGAARIDEILHAIVARIARRCDACLRIGGPSPAADQAARIFEDLGLPVFRRLADVPGCEERCARA